MDTKQATARLEALIRSKSPIIAIDTHEEHRVTISIKKLAQKLGMGVATWSITAGLAGNNVTDVLTGELTEPNWLFDAFLKNDLSAIKPTIFILYDLHPYLKDNPVLIRYAREVSDKVTFSDHAVILVSPNYDGVSPDVEKSIVRLSWPLPGDGEIDAIIDAVKISLPVSVPVTINGNRESVVRALRGLTAKEAESALLTSIIYAGGFSDDVIPYIVKEKSGLFKSTAGLTYYSETETMTNVAGLEAFKNYASMKMATFSADAQKQGVDPARGVLLIGPPGTGKSLCAKAIPGGVKPLLRYDFGGLFGPLLGQTEGQVRAAWRVADALSACLWLDEIEKGLGGGNSESDGGTTGRALGTFLTLSEETRGVFMIATSNNIRELRPEILRRFDDIFFVDLPDREARAQCFEIHLQKRGRFTFPNHWEMLADLTWSYSGAEIEKVVRLAIERTFFENRELQVKDLVDACNSIVPLYKTQGENIKALREWARDRAHWAGNPLEPKPEIKQKYERVINYE